MICNIWHIWQKSFNSSAEAEDITVFKKSDKTKKAFKCLFKADDDKSLPYVEAIKTKAWGKKKTTTVDTAFTLAVCEVVLNPRHPRISVSDNALHKRFDTYWVCKKCNYITCD